MPTEVGLSVKFKSAEYFEREKAFYRNVEAIISMMQMEDAENGSLRQN